MLRLIRCCGRLCGGADFWLTFVKHVVLFSAGIFLVLLPCVCHNLPHSLYYKIFTSKQAADKLLIQANNNRVEKAQNLLKYLHVPPGAMDVHKNLTKNSDDTSRLRIVITVVTVSRDNLVAHDSYSPKYLTQVTANFLHLINQLPEHSKLNAHFSICNMDPRPHAHEEADNMSKYSQVHVKPLSPREWSFHPEERLKQGYSYCLQKALDYSPDFVFVIEDDAVPNTDLFTVLEWTIHNFMNKSFIPHNSKASVSLQRIKDTVYLKFYHPERLLGFIALDPERLPELFSYSALIGTLLLFLYYWSRPNSRAQIWEHVYPIWGVFLVLSALACICIGRVNLIGFRHLLPPYLYYITPTPSCCTQAVLYPTQSVQPVLDHLNNVTCNKTFSIDHALDWYIGQHGRRAYLVQPNVFTHVGMYSAHKRNRMDPFLVV